MKMMRLALGPALPWAFSSLRAALCSTSRLMTASSYSSGWGTNRGETFMAKARRKPFFSKFRFWAQVSLVMENGSGAFANGAKLKPRARAAGKAARESLCRNPRAFRPEANRP